MTTLTSISPKLTSDNSTPNRPFVRLGFDEKEAMEIVDKLNVLLAAYQVHYQKLRNYHWNIRGGDFYEMHQVFENLYTEVFEQIDVLAERIITIGRRPLSRMEDYLEASPIRETGSNLDSRSMATEIVRDFEALLECLVDAHGTCAGYGDISSVNMLMRFGEKLEKNHWMLRSWLK